MVQEVDQLNYQRLGTPLSWYTILIKGHCCKNQVMLSYVGQVAFRTCKLVYWFTGLLLVQECQLNLGWKNQVKHMFGSQGDLSGPIWSIISANLIVQLIIHPNCSYLCCCGYVPVAELVEHSTSNTMIMVFISSCKLAWTS